jgi:hypothetical protein
VEQDLGMHAGIGSQSQSRRLQAAVQGHGVTVRNARGKRCTDSGVGVVGDCARATVIWRFAIQDRSRASGRTQPRWMG